MISKIILNNVASYKVTTILETDKKVNLIYGLNGTGKSIFSNFLYKSDEEKFKDCLIEGLNDDDILVYNQTFIEDNFFESENLKGIFTLSKKNKEAETKILNAGKEIERIEGEKLTKEEDFRSAREEIDAKQVAARNKIWEIKTDYTGGDRVLEYCLEGYRNDSKKLFAYIESFKKSQNKPAKTIESIKEEVQALAGDNAKKYDPLPVVNFTVQSIEKELIFNKQIVGNENSTVSGLINKLGSSDWIKDGLKYLPTVVKEGKEVCPFCQEKTISANLLASIKDYFDESYEADLNKLKAFLVEYSEAIEIIPDKTIFEANPKLEIEKKDFEIKYTAFTKILSDNQKLIDSKIKSPSLSVTLTSSKKSLEELNKIIESVNKLVAEHNTKIDNKEKALEEIKDTFWQIMRWDYDQTIDAYVNDNAASKKKIALITKAIEAFILEVVKQRKIIVEQQKQTVNIEEAILNINNGLIDLGIEDFKIKKHSENLYTIIRKDSETKIFQSLSEGEKMIISFLYFLELCKGKKDVTDVGKRKIIVIDDPISSLSHIYIFNVGRLIHNEFLRSDKYEQFFLLTHSLYFFYELANRDRENREKRQKLFRIRKNSLGSEIVEMRFEDIQNDYHSYWLVIKDEKQPPALIANCMRNII